MAKLFWGMIAAGLVLCTGHLANAAEEDSVHNRFRAVGNTEFNGDNVAKCRVKIFKTRERVSTWVRDVIYELCTQNNKPVYLTRCLLVHVINFDLLERSRIRVTFTKPGFFEPLRILTQTTTLRRN